jgi:lysozyme family protein
MDVFEDALAATLEYEGFFSNHPEDWGGATTFGITEKTARFHDYHGNMRDLPIEKAREIYRKSYWDRLRLDEVGAFDEAIAIKLFDIAVNMGIDDAGNFLQRAINAMSRNQKLYPYLKVDNIIGSKTIAAMKKLFSPDDRLTVYKMINALQGAKYLWQREKNPAFGVFIRGLFRRISSHHY